MSRGLRSTTTSAAAEPCRRQHRSSCRRFFLPLLIAHEAYPGHHTEHVWKEALLVDEGGYVDETIFLVGTPQAVVTEGIAMIALELALREEADAVAARIFPVSRTTRRRRAPCGSYATRRAA